MPSAKPKKVTDKVETKVSKIESKRQAIQRMAEIQKNKKSQNS